MFVNHLEKLARLRNAYYGMRHGLSIPQTNNVIVSSPIHGIQSEYSLVQTGKEQVRASIVAAKNSGLLGAEIIIFSSLFSRAFDSAQIAKDVLSVPRKIIKEGRLRERWFGEFEKKSAENYQTVWDYDLLDPHHRRFSVEPVMQVLERETELISCLEKDFSGQTFLLVGHGDGLQILEAAFNRISPAYHRRLPSWQSGEIRKLTLTFEKENS